MFFLLYCILSGSQLDIDRVLMLLPQWSKTVSYSLSLLNHSMWYHVWTCSNSFINSIFGFSFCTSSFPELGICKSWLCHLFRNTSLMHLKSLSFLIPRLFASQDIHYWLYGKKKTLSSRIFYVMNWWKSAPAVCRMHLLYSFFLWLILEL